MRTLLQNRAVVGCLVVLAFGSVGWRILSVVGSHPITVAARGTPQPLASPPRFRDGLRAASSSLRDRLTNWQALFSERQIKRDPFAGRFPASEPEISASNGANPQAGPLPLLQAISIEPKGAYAVVNRRVVQEGESLDGYLVEKIHAEKVWLKHPGGRMVLRLEYGQPTSNTAVNPVQKRSHP
jgi:hypothetical protein